MTGWPSAGQPNSSDLLHVLFGAAMLFQPVTLAEHERVGLQRQSRVYLRPAHVECSSVRTWAADSPTHANTNST